MKNWFLLYTKPRHEDSVSLRLLGAGFETLNPKIRERKYYRRKITDVVSPLFPCYIFASFDRFKDYHLFKYTRGVKRVLSNEDGPAIVPDNVIHSILDRMNDGVITVKASFKPGETVMIKGGPFVGFEAIFEKEMKGMERVSILFKTVNVRVLVDGSTLSRC